MQPHDPLRVVSVQQTWGERVEKVHFDARRAGKCHPWLGRHFSETTEKVTMEGGEKLEWAVPCLPHALGRRFLLGERE